MLHAETELNVDERLGGGFRLGRKGCREQLFPPHGERRVRVCKKVTKNLVRILKINEKVATLHERNAPAPDRSIFNLFEGGVGAIIQKYQYD